MVLVWFMVGIGINNLNDSSVVFILCFQVFLECWCGMIVWIVKFDLVFLVDFCRGNEYEYC